MNTLRPRSSDYTNGCTVLRSMKTTTKIVIGTVLLLGVTAIILPNFLTPRICSSQSACVGCLELVQLAKTRWAETYHKGPLDRPTEFDLFSKSNSVLLSKGTPYQPSTFEHFPACPAGSNILIGAMNEEPRCTSGDPGHCLHPKND